MTNKAYIVTNEEQECEVLDKLERWGAEWGRSKSKPTDFIPSHVEHTTKLPYALLVENDQISWCDIEALYEFDDIVYDGRKEENMSEKYVVSQEFMNELEEWKEAYITDTLDEKYHYVSAGDLDTLPGMIKDWWIELNKPTETNNRLITIIRWVNGEDVFEVEKPKKWVVRSKDASVGDRHLYVNLNISYGVKDTTTGWTKATATRFDTKEEAESWANSHQEVIEVN